MKQIIYYLTIFAVALTSCVTPTNDRVEKMIKKIKTETIKDTRLEYFSVLEEVSKGETKICGATVSKAAFDRLKQMAAEKELAFEVKLLPEEQFKTNQWAVVTLSVCNIRSAGKHSAEMLTQALMGTPVKVYAKQDDWYLIQTPDLYFGWVDAAGIALKSNAEVQELKTLPKVLFDRQAGFAYQSANTESGIAFDVVLADLLTIAGAEKNFYKIILADGRVGFVKKSECTSLSIWNKKKVKAEDVLTTAFDFMGTPYLWGGTSAKMVDCSGFVKSSYYYHGMILQRDASQQTNYGELIETTNGYAVLQAGDLVFFGKNNRVTHVGMCMGNQEFIHASGKVRINSLDRKSEKYTEHYETSFIRARRVIDQVDGIGIEWIVDNKFYQEILP